MDWKSFWDQPNSIYVNERHRLVHYRLIADELVQIADKERPVLLDHGCGEALEADRVARACAKLILVDAAPSVCAKLAERFGGISQIAIAAPQDIAALADQSLDIVVANSVLQYLSAEELGASLRLWRAKLKPTGRLVLADVVLPDVSPLADVAALLKLAASEGFLLAALVGLVRTALSPYAKLRKSLGLSKHGERDLLERLASAGFSGKRQTRNFGHNQARMTIIARPN